ncbi:MAG: hypothetical protein M1828_000597 [Chrysothrix sp. TS-e1954]|nr:MAG: hypothetical protein M1828_000597 [Chrysothrix sp. TS-e1954]
MQDVVPETPDQQQSNPQVPHTLVTPESEHENPTPNIPQAAVASDSLPHPEQHTASIFSPSIVANAHHNTMPDRTSPSVPSRSFALSPPTTAGSSTSRALPIMSASESRSILEDMQQAEKDTDDPSTSLDPRKSLYRGNSTTTTRLNKLFAAGMPISPLSSRENSYSKATGVSAPYIRAYPQDGTTPLPNHLYQRGLLGGRHSDINIKVFGETYHAHRIVLDRAPFFASALTEPWCEASQRDVELHPEDADANITKTTFELALKRLYGCQDPFEEHSEAVGLFATGCWLEMHDLIDSSVDALVRRLCPRNLADTIHLLTANYYGKAGEKILAAAKSMLCRDGWEMPLKYWDDIPGDTVREVVGGDGFFVAGEWDRWTLAKRLLNRRLKLTARELHLWPMDSRGVPTQLRQKPIRTEGVEETNGSIKNARSDTADDEADEDTRPWRELYSHPSIRPLLSLLDEDIHYVHLEYEQLQQLRCASDMFNIPLIPAQIITGALWAQMELRQTVLNTNEKALTLSLTKHAAEPYPPAHSLDATDTQTQTQCKEASAPTLSTQEASDGSISLATLNPPRFWIPNTDCNTIIGGRHEAAAVSTPFRSANRHASSLSATLQNEDPQWYSEPNTELLPRSATAKQYSSFPPFRFAAQFPNPRTLKERKRVYSRTVFYAGSLWNLYIQKVKSGTKSPQLGVYLHRAKEKETDDNGTVGSAYVTRASVEQRIGAMERELLHTNQSVRGRRQYVWEPVGEAEASGGNSSGDPDATMAVTPSRAIPRTGLSTFMASTTPRKSARQSLVPNPSTAFDDSTSGSEAEPDTAGISHAPATESPRRSHIPALPPYTDMRPTIKTYFKIFGPSKGGRMLSVYESAPDNFNFSQSWGWKSSTLMADEEEEDERLEVDAKEKDEAKKDWRRSRDGKLRFMVVLGVV